MTLWIDPTDASTITTATGIARIADKAGVLTNAWFNADSGAATEPTVASYVTRNWMRFDGNDDDLFGYKNAGATALYLSDVFGSGGKSFELHLVMRPDNNSACAAAPPASNCGNNSASPWQNTGVFAPNAGYFGLFVSDMHTATPDIQAYMWDTTARVTTYASVAGDQQVFGMSMTDPGGGTGPYNTYEDGAVTAIAGVGALHVSAYTLNQVHLGKIFGSAYNYKGLIGEILVFNRELTAGERANLSNYLSTKWATP
jgi:hypothetical protein